MMDIKDAALHRIRFRNDEESETVKVLVDRIRELEASVREWSDRAMEFSNLASKYEEELAAVRQRTLAIDRFHKCGGDSEQDPIERLRLFCSIAMNGQDWLDVEQFFDALRQQQSEPVAEIGWAAGVEGGITEVIGLADDFYDLPVGTKLYCEAAPKQQGEPVAYLRDDGDGGFEFSAPGDGFAVYREAAPEHAHADDISEKRVAETAKNKHEPVAWLYESKNLYWVSSIRDKDKSEGVTETPLYREAAPEPKEKE